jgi:hypothetical protein
LGFKLLTDENEQNQTDVSSETRPDTGLAVFGQWLVDVFLFCATAAVVIWQNSRITVLYDLCGVLEPAYRMSLGDRPYADFPFPYAPLTFFIQSWIIRLWGTVYWHHVAYAAIIAGLATVVTWRILNRLFRDSFSRPALTAFLLTLPLIPLGVYCIFPHPFYDPDAMFFILVSIASVLWIEQHEWPTLPTFFAGMLLVIPLFVKQNIGLAYLGSWLLVLVFLLGIALWKKDSPRGYVALLVGSVIGSGLAAVIVQSWVGLATYKYWTWDFARLRRTPSATDMLSVYQDPLLAVWLTCFFAGALLFWYFGREPKVEDVRLNGQDSQPGKGDEQFGQKRHREGACEIIDHSNIEQQDDNRRSKKILLLPSVLLMSAPFIWPVIYLAIDTDASERAERLVNIWPVVLVASIVVCIFSARRLTGIKKFLPIILVATAHGVFLSQQLWGSTYGIWPMLVILLGLIILSLKELTERRFSGWLTAFAFLASVPLVIAGASYIYSNDRLDYVDFEDGDMQHSKLPQLAGLSIRGDYLPQFEELVDYVDKNIPPDEGILTLPGEDLFYYTTGRRPRMPALLFDVTNNPYTAEELAQIAHERDIRWLIVKNDLQIEVDKTIDDKDHIFDVLKPEFKHVDSLDNYEIYRRKLAGETDDDEDDGTEDSDDDSAN